MFAAIEIKSGISPEEYKWQILKFREKYPWALFVRDDQTSFTDNGVVIVFGSSPKVN